ncbi:ssDNA-binding protein [Litorimonas haliclonae]|uniref:ssDNA-binding protein n=1 Tax=Litorimonas haliclonae TaxID=2081977 RepID=UPI0039F025D0
MSQFIFIKGARVSFPHLFTKPIINGDEGSCGATLMLDRTKHKATIEKIKADGEELRKNALKNARVPDDKWCLRAGEDKGRPEYDGYDVVSANNRGRPTVIDGTGTGVVTNEEDNKIYAGCYVNAKIRLWAQNNKYGKRINAELVSIQFSADGEPLDSSYVSVDEAMEGFGATGTDDDFLDS